MDEADRAAKYEQQAIKAAISHREEVPRLVRNGACHWCEAPVGPRQLFCDSECERDWQKWTRKERSRGA